MNNSSLINTENEVFYIYIAISILGLISNDLELKDKEKNHDTIKFISISSAIALLIVYLYFLYISYKKYKKQNNTRHTLILISSILFFIAGIINLYVELKYQTDNEEDGLEI